MKARGTSPAPVIDRPRRGLLGALLALPAAAVARLLGRPQRGEVLADGGPIERAPRSSLVVRPAPHTVKRHG